MDNIIFIEENIPFLRDALKPLGKVRTFTGRDLTNEQLLQEKCNMLIVRSTTKVNSSLLRGTDVKFVGTATSGIDHIDTDYLSRNSIYFSHALGSNANSVAEYVVFSILKWSRENNISLSGKTAGVVGFGNIGKLVAKYANFMGLNVLINDPPLLDNDFEFPGFAKYAELDFLLTNSDIVTNHVPLTESGKYPTLNLFNYSNLGKLKKDSLFIHASRGRVADETALINACDLLRLKTVIDVWANEPDFNSDLAERSMIATPHIAGYSFDGKLKGALMVAGDAGKFTGGKPDLSTINSELSFFRPLGQSFYKDRDFLYGTLKNSRMIENDTLDFLELVNMSLDNKKRQFDLLRKNYPVRREIL